MKLYLLLIAFFLPYFSSAQNKIASVEFPNTIRIEKDEASFSGAGIRKRLWVDVYAIALFHNESTNNPYKVIQSEKPMGVKIHVLARFLTRTKYVTALKEGFIKSTGNNTKPIKTKIDHFFSILDENFTYGDVCEILYHPDTGVKVYTNDKLKGVIKGVEFKEALYGIWLKHPSVDQKLAKKMLGKNVPYVSN